MLDPYCFKGQWPRIPSGIVDIMSHYILIYCHAKKQSEKVSFQRSTYALKIDKNNLKKFNNYKQTKMAKLFLYQKLAYSVFGIIFIWLDLLSTMQMHRPATIWLNKFLSQTSI